VVLKSPKKRKRTKNKAAYDGKVFPFPQNFPENQTEVL
jgi:hypothetical protein